MAFYHFTYILTLEIPNIYIQYKIQTDTNRNWVNTIVLIQVNSKQLYKKKFRQ